MYYHYYKSVPLFFLLTTVSVHVKAFSSPKSNSLQLQRVVFNFRYQYVNSINIRNTGSTDRKLPRYSILPGTDTESNDCLLISEDDDDEKLCCIENLDACFEDPNLDSSIDDVECSIENLDACANIGNKTPDSSQQSLRSFLAKPIIEVQLAFLVVLSSLLVGIGTLQSIPPILATFTEYAELSISALFTLEYFARWKLNNFSFKYLIEPLAIIDFLAILPGLIKFATIINIHVPPTLVGGALINLRLLRILRLQRVLTDYTSFQKFELALGLPASDTRPYQLQLARVVISIFTLLSVTSGLIYSVEHSVNPDIPDYFTAVYFGIITLTTVGFGDIHPVTNAGRWIISGAIIVASGVIPAQAAALVEALLDRERESDEKKQGVLASTTLSNSDCKSDINGKTFSNNENDHAYLDERLSRLEEKFQDMNTRIDRVLQLLIEKEERIP